MALSVRQRILFQETVDIYEPVLERNPSTGKPTERTFPPAETGVCCYMVPRDDVSGPAIVFRLPGDNMFTHDEWHFSESQRIGENWRIRKKTVNANGEQAEDYGEFWLVSGQPRRDIKLGNRDAGNTVVQATRETEPPQELVLV